MDLITDKLILLASKKETYWEAYSIVKLGTSSDEEFNTIMTEVRIKWLNCHRG